MKYNIKINVKIHWWYIGGNFGGKKMKKRFVSFMLAVAMLLLGNQSVYATNRTTESTGATISSNYIEAKGNVGASATVEAPNWKTSVSINLESYFGITKKFIINNRTDSTTGALHMILTQPNGKIFAQNWEIHLNEYQTFSAVLPTSGRWGVILMGENLNAPVEVFVRWE